MNKKPKRLCSAFSVILQAINTYREQTCGAIWNILKMSVQTYLSLVQKIQIHVGE